MADELIDICDEDNNVIGQAMKSEALAKNLWHRGARILFYNTKGEILIQLRSKDKELFSDRWDVGAAGHVAAGEDYADAAIREAKEELGIEVKKDDLNLLMIEKCQTPWGNIQEKVFAATYLAKFDGYLGELKIQQEEVQEIKFISADSLAAEYKKQPQLFTPYADKYRAKLISEVKKITEKQ